MAARAKAEGRSVADRKTGRRRARWLGPSRHALRVRLRATRRRQDDRRPRDRVADRLQAPAQPHADRAAAGDLRVRHPVVRRAGRRLPPPDIEEALVSELPGLVFTMVWGLDLPEDRALVSSYVGLVEAAGGRVTFVELYAGLGERLERNRTELRLAEKRSKRDLDWSHGNVVELERFVMSTGGRRPSRTTCWRRTSTSGSTTRRSARPRRPTGSSRLWLPEPGRQRRGAARAPGGRVEGERAPTASGGRRRPAPPPVVGVQGAT